MILSRAVPVYEKRESHHIHATISTEHPASHRGQPVIVLEDGSALDLASWTAFDYHVVNASKKEMSVLKSMGFV